MTFFKSTSSCYLPRLAWLITVIFYVLNLSACSSVVPEHKSQSDNIKSVSQEIIDIALLPQQSNSASNKKTLNDELKPDQAVLDTTTVNTTLSLSLYEQFIAEQKQLRAELPTAIKQLYQQALIEMKNQQWHKANLLWDKVIQLQPALTSSYLNKALIAYQQKAFELAQKLLQQAQQVNNKNPYVFNLQGVIAREQGHFDKAQQHYQQALKLWPNYPEAHLNIAILFELYRGKFERAKQHYLAYLALKPNDQQAKRWLAGLDIKLAAISPN